MIWKHYSKQQTENICCQYINAHFNHLFFISLLIYCCFKDSIPTVSLFHFVSTVEMKLRKYTWQIKLILVYHATFVFQIIVDFMPFLHDPETNWKKNLIAWLQGHCILEDDRDYFRILTWLWVVLPKEDDQFCIFLWRHVVVLNWALWLNCSGDINNFQESKVQWLHALLQ